VSLNQVTEIKTLPIIDLDIVAYALTLPRTIFAEKAIYF